MKPTADDITVTFAKRQTKDSRFSHFEGDEDELIRRVLFHWGEQTPGYRDGVILVPVRPDGFFSGVVQLKDGDDLVGKYEPRQKGEEPRKSVAVPGGEKLPAAVVEVVLYHHKVLEEEDGYEPASMWEVISINARTTEGPEPMPPETLMANHFGASGGTETKMSPEEFEKALRESYDYWKDKCLIHQP